MVRDGQRREVGSGELLVGDVMLLATGDILPADGMLFEGVDIRRAQLPSELPPCSGSGQDWLALLHLRHAFSEQRAARLSTD